MKIEQLKPGKYVVAVSGGIDSMVLLDCLVAAKHTGVELIVAHVQHGIRENAALDETLVRETAEHYGLAFESISLQLGPNASEDQARQARWHFLHDIARRYGAAIITAHHQDDIIETALLNLLRGTGWRGLASLRQTAGVLRPFRKFSKQDIKNYAQEHNISWHEDITNIDIKYRRNWVRHLLLPLLKKRDPEFTGGLVAIIDQQVVLREEIENAVAEVAEQCIVARQLDLVEYKNFEHAIRQETIRYFLANQQVYLTWPQLDRLDTFVMSANRNQKYSLDGRYFAVRREGFLVVEPIADVL